MNPFEVLGLPAVFSLDLKELEKRHRDLSRALHPDKFVGTGASERRESLNKAVEANEAFRVVRDPVARAEALFRLVGIAVGERNEPMAAPDFLMEVMEWREALAEARAVRDAPAVAALAAEVRDRASASEAVLAAAFGPAGTDPHQLQLAQAQLAALRFYQRFLEEVAAIDEAWQDEAAP
jgi:molecular chaperone HscB